YVSAMSVKPDVIALGAHGRVLGTRELGKELAAQLRDRAAATGAPVLVDFEGVAVASSPVLDEIACALRAVIADHPDRFVLLANLTDDVWHTLELVLEQRRMSLTAIRGQQLELLGGREHLEATLAAAQKMGTFTATELADRLKLTVPNLHQRLTELQ